MEVDSRHPHSIGDFLFALTKNFLIPCSFPSKVGIIFCPKITTIKMRSEMLRAQQTIIRRFQNCRVIEGGLLSGHDGICEGIRAPNSAM